MKWRPSSEEPDERVRYAILANTSFGSGIRTEGPVVMTRLPTGDWSPAVANVLPHILPRPRFKWSEIAPAYTHWFGFMYPDEVDYDR